MGLWCITRSFILGVPRFFAYGHDSSAIALVSVLCRSTSVYVSAVCVRVCVCACVCVCVCVCVQV